MPTITVTAPDSALAMDEVVRQLGSEAYIVSTSQLDGLVQIKATIDPMTPLQRRSGNVQTVFEDELEKQFLLNKPTKMSDQPELAASKADSAKFSAIEGGVRVSTDNKQETSSKKISNTTIESTVGRVEPIFKQHYAQPLKTNSQLSVEQRLNRLENLMQVEDVFYADVNQFEYQKIVELGFNRSLVDEAVKDRISSGLPTSQADLIRYFAEQVVSSKVHKSYSADILVVFGPSGCGKTTLAAKFATLLGDMNGARDVQLISLDDLTAPQGSLLEHYCKQINIPIIRCPILDQALWPPIDKEKQYILDVACSTESALEVWPQLLEYFSNLDVEVLVALPSGLNTKRLSNELMKTQHLLPKVVLTKLDESDFSVPEIAQLLSCSSRVGWLTGQQDLTGKLVEASADSMEQYLQEAIKETLTAENKPQ